MRLLVCAFWKGAPVKVICLVGTDMLYTLCCCLDSHFSEIKCEVGGKFHAKCCLRFESDSRQVPCGTFEKYFEENVN